MVELHVAKIKFGRYVSEGIHHAGSYITKTISLAKQVDILFKHGRDQGLPITYRAVAEAAGGTANNIFRDEP